MGVNGVIAELVALDDPSVDEPAGVDAVPLVSGVPLRTPPADDRPKPDAEEPTEGAVRVPVAERGDRVDVLDEPMELEGTDSAESGRRPGGHELWLIVLVEPAG
jgi:hypothetical protein